MKIQLTLSRKNLLYPLIVAIGVVVTLALLSPFNTMAQTPTPPPYCPTPPAPECPCVVGEVAAFAGDTAPACYLLANGAAVDRTTYSELFSVIGTTYGSGDGSTTFNMPNLKGRMSVGFDAGQTEFNTLGETGGEKAHTLTVSEMPPHSHNFYFDNSQSGHTGARKTSYANTTMSTSSVGGGQAHNNMPPYFTLNYIICVGQ